MSDTFYREMRGANETFIRAHAGRLIGILDAFSDETIDKLAQGLLKAVRVAEKIKTKTETEAK